MVQTANYTDTGMLGKKVAFIVECYMMENWQLVLENPSSSVVYRRDFIRQKSWVIMSKGSGVVGSVD